MITLAEFEAMSHKQQDELISTKVMGFTLSDEFPVNTVLTGHTPTSFRVFTPSSDIASAWEVVEKVQAMGLSFEVRRWSYPGARWFAEIGGGMRGEGDSAPEAICLAAFKFLGVDVE